MLVSDDRPGLLGAQTDEAVRPADDPGRVVSGCEESAVRLGLSGMPITRGDLYHHSCQLVGALATDSCIGVPERKSGRVCPGWFDRLLLILALAYWILPAVALVAKQRYLPGMWCSGN